MMVGISLWGDAETEKALRGRDAFAISAKNYEGDAYTYYLYTITSQQLGKVETMVRRIRDIGVKVHFQLLSNDEDADGFSWSDRSNWSMCAPRWTTFARPLSRDGHFVALLPPGPDDRDHARPPLRLARVPFGVRDPSTGGSRSRAG